MTSEAIQYAARAIIDYLGGNVQECKRLSRLATKANSRMVCANCGGIKLPCRVGRKGNWKHGYICTDCGQITVGGVMYRCCYVPLRRVSADAGLQVQKQC